jgi:hypothetical protein
MNRARITSRPAAMREARRHYLAMSAGHADWEFSSSLKIAWSKHRADTRATDFLMAEIAKTIGKHLAGATVAAALSCGGASAQVADESGWSQPSVNGGEYGQRRDGVQWQSRDVNGTNFYSDTTGKHCWTQSNGSGGSFTSCSQ